MNTQSSFAPDEMLSLEEAALLLCVSKSTLYRLIERKQVKGRKVGSRWRFRRADLLNYLDRSAHDAAVASADPGEIDRLLASLEDASQRIGVPMPSLDPAQSPKSRLEAYADHLLRLATKSGASDIHITPERDDTVVQVRIDGILHELCRIPCGAHAAVIGQLKQRAGIAVDEHCAPQDGRIATEIAGRRYALRITTMPTRLGECAVLRILDQSTIFVGLEKLNLSGGDLARLRRWICAPSGLVLCAGPAGSGKTTTIYSCLQEIAGPQVSTVTVEDPIEMTLPHVTQTAANRRAGLTLAAALRAATRLDPDILFVGEMRDRETAQMVIEEALTGHRVFAAMHADDAASAALRLVEMGVERFLVGVAPECLRGIVSQRLARRICPDCRQTVRLHSTISAQIRELAQQGGLIVPPETPFYRGAGCDACGGRGYRGRTGIYELMEFSPDVGAAFVTDARREKLVRIAVAEGMRTLLADGVRKAMAGITTVEEVFRVVGVAMMKGNESSLPQAA